MISVVANDNQGNASEPASIVVQVVQSISDVSATITPTATVTPEGLSLTQTSQAGCTNDANFLEHVTIPPNSYLTTGSNFTKIWRVNNNGTCDWIGYDLIHISGELMGAGSPQALPMVSAGANADIAIEMAAPAGPGTYTASWRIRGADGTVFGPELTLTIIVPQTPTNTPQPTATATPTPAPTSTQAPLSVTQVSDQMSISAGNTQNMTVSCPAGSVAVSGGFASNDGLRVWHSFMNGNGWRVYATNTAGTTKSINVYVACLHNSGGTTSLQMVQKYANSNDFTQLQIGCPSGSVATGGAWVIGSDPAIQIYNSSPSGNGWQIYVDNSSSNTPLINAYAVCLAGVSGTTSSFTNSGGVIPPNDIEHLVQGCPSGTFVTGGGFAVNLGATIYNTSLTGNAWQNYARNYTADQKNLYTYAICYAP